MHGSCLNLVEAKIEEKKGQTHVNSYSVCKFSHFMYSVFMGRGRFLCRIIYLRPLFGSSTCMSISLRRITPAIFGCVIRKDNCGPLQEMIDLHIIPQYCTVMCIN